MQSKCENVPCKFFGFLDFLGVIQFNLSESEFTEFENFQNNNNGFFQN